MRVRPYTEADLDALQRMHAAQGFDYSFPALENPIFLSKLMLEDEAGVAVMASLLRLTSEAYLLADPRAGTPRERWERLMALERAAARDAFARGLDDAHCWLPPRIARRFGRRLAALGWVRDDTWTPFCKRFAAPPFPEKVLGEAPRVSLPPAA